MTEQNGFKYSILASGSTGNSFYLETPKKKILVDAGLSGKKIESLLSEIDRDIHDIDALLITHEHSDHIKGIGVLARKYGIDLYANEDTWSELDSKNALGKIPVEQKHLFEMGKTMTFGDIDIESFGVSHDAIAPQFYRFMKDNKSFVMLTDTGYVSAIMVADTWIASPKITKRLFDMMHAVGEFKMPMTELLDSVTKVVEHDMPIMVANADKLAPKLGTPKPVAAKPRKVVEKVTGVWQGQEVAFAKTWSDHTFTDEEIARLLRGEEISFASKSKRGKSYTATGKLAKQTFKGATFYGFKLNPKPRKSSK